MNRFKGKIPPYIVRCLWSYNTDNIDIKADKELIITQVLNYGEWEAVKWLYKVYPEDEIKQVVRHPRRGLWLRQVLNFWLTMFKIRLPYHVSDRAIFHLEPDITAGASGENLSKDI
ncbi:MAG: hypothetical protein Q7J27_14405 [Syntrophales bacterium]|nr:hypothetical protein [Syntrophales bacterium]